MSQKGFSAIVILLCIVVILSLIIGAYINLKKKDEEMINATKPTAKISSTQPSDTTAKMKEYTFNDFTISVPSDWSTNITEEKGIYWFDGKSNLYINKSDAKNIDEIDEDLEVSWSASPSKEKNITLGTANGKEYYDCFGVEGCTKGYFVAIDNGGKLYGIQYITHSDEDSKSDIEIYNKIISTLKFH